VETLSAAYVGDHPGFVDGVAVVDLPGWPHPVALAWLATRTDRRTVVQSAAALLAALAIPAAAALAISSDGALGAVAYHLERPVQIESLPATGLLLLDQLGAGEAQGVNSHRSDGLEHPAADAVASLFATALVGLVALLCAAAARRPDRRALVLAALTGAVAFAALGKVLSPQFVIWALPLGALAFAWRLHALAAAVAAAAVLTQVEFPARYLDVVAREPFALGVVALRNLMLLAAVALALRALHARGHQELLDRRRPAVAVGLDQ
jgi:hypothetical protein